MVSVVILTTGKAELVQRCLDRQTYKDFEVLIASEDGIVNAMNKALARAKGDIFARVDDDVYIPKDWLENLVSCFKPHDVAGATGPTFVPFECRENRDSIRLWENPHWFLRWLTDYKFNPAGLHRCGVVSYDSNYEERFKDSMGTFVCDHLEGTNWAMRTQLIKDVGGFDPKFDGVAEWFDTDVEQKIKKKNYVLIYNPKAIVYHLLKKTEHYGDRFKWFGRIKNWMRFHARHSKFHYKMVIFLLVWIGYFLCPKSRS